MSKNNWKLRTYSLSTSNYIGPWNYIKILKKIPIYGTKIQLLKFNNNQNNLKLHVFGILKILTFKFMKF